MTDVIVKCEVSLDYIFFPKNVSSVNSGEFAIFTANVHSMTEPDDLFLPSIKLKGNVCSLERREKYNVTCKLAETHEQYGDTYEIIYISRQVDMSSKKKQRLFLQNIINENAVDGLFEMYDDVIKLLNERDVESLIKVKGIGNATALRIIDEYEDSKDYSAIYTELGELGLTHNLIKRLTEFYKSPDVVIDVIKNNPYDLVAVHGIGFKRADEIALKMGMDVNDYRRVKGFLLFTLNKHGEAGRSFLYYMDLIQELYSVLGVVSEETINQTAKSMMDNGDVVVLDNGNIIALQKFFQLEVNICNELMRLQYGEVDSNGVDYIPNSEIPDNWEEIVKEVELEQGFEFTSKQRLAIDLSRTNNVVAITGGGGSGKTSAAKGILSIYEDHGVMAVALAGKAAVRITEATGIEASTIHRGLAWEFGGFTYNSGNKLRIDDVLLDESTMVGGELFLSLLSAIPTGTKLILMGDVNQLTSIGSCNVFSDILEANVLPIVVLDEIHRQAKASGIISTSMAVAEQKQLFSTNYNGIDVLGELQDMVIDITSTKDEYSDKVISYFQTEMQKYGNDLMEVQVIVAQKFRGDLSCYNINTRIQDLYNPKMFDGNEIEIFLEKTQSEIKKYYLREGDKVINTKNNYRCVNDNGVVTPVFNGNVGIITEITDKGYCTVDFEGIGRICLSNEESKSLWLGYAITIHKMQGNQQTSVIVALDNGSYKMNNSELLYTGISRAINHCTLIGNAYAINKAIETKEVKTKQTFLKRMLQAWVEEWNEKKEVEDLNG